MLPLHIACKSRAPVEVINAIHNAYPEVANEKDGISMKKDVAAGMLFLIPRCRINYPFEPPVESPCIILARKAFP